MNPTKFPFSALCAPMASMMVAAALSSAAFVSTTLVSAPALADDEEDEGKSDEEIEAEERARKRKKAEAAEAAAAATAAESVKSSGSDGTKDHDRWVGHMGVGWFGVSSVPIAAGSPTGTDENPGIAPGGTASLSVPTIGVRYWLSERAGIDAGVGFSLATGSISATTQAADKQTAWGVAAHLGLPLSLASGKHISIQLTPEVNFGYASSTVDPAVQKDPPPAAELGGTRLDVGARFGGEVHFGFMDIPELALEGSVGAYLTHQRTTITVKDVEYADSSVLFTTASFKNPWEIFTSTIAARYYF